jgi:hypothetical protein
MSYYTNVTLRGPTHAQVLSYLREHPREAFVSPTYPGDLTVIYDAASEAQNGSGYAFVEPISKALHCLALYVTLSDGTLMYRLYKSGKVIDAYDSWPGYWEEDEPDHPVGGDAILLCEEFGRPDASMRVETILRAWPHDTDVPPGNFAYGDEHARHYELREALGLPMIADRGYDRINEGMFPDGLTEDELSLVTADGPIIDRAAGSAQTDAYVTFTSYLGNSFTAPSRFTAEDKEKFFFTLTSPDGHVEINAITFAAHNTGSLRAFGEMMVEDVRPKSVKAWKPSGWSTITLADGREARKIELVPDAGSERQWRLYIVDGGQLYHAILLGAPDAIMGLEGGRYEDIVRTFDGVRR